MGKSVTSRISLMKHANFNELDIIRLAQVQGILTHGTYPHVFNACCCIFIVILHGVDRGIGNGHALAWATANLAVLLFRTLSMRRAAQALAAGADPRVILWWTAVQALVGGMLWAALPFALGGIDIKGAQSYVLIVMFGMSTGTLIRGVPHSGIAACFFLPPLFSAVSLLAATPDMQAVLLSISIMFLGFMMLRSARASEADFLQAAESRLEADTLAHSLEAAAIDIESNSRRLQILANRDPLTGLANRERFAEELKADMRTNRVLSLIVLDLNRFRSVNDQFGHAAGDRLLIEVSRRLLEAVGDEGLVARVGSDEFAILCNRADAERIGWTIASRVLDVLKRPVMLTEKPYIISASIGIVSYPAHGETASDLFAFANLALLDAKSGNKSRSAATSFSAELRQKAERQRQIENDLPDAIRHGAVTAWFQPQLWLTDLRLAGLESLVRWEHPSLGFISPEEIVQAAEKVQALPHLTGLMAEHACRMIRHLDGIGLPDVTVALNISPREFGIYPVADMICAITRHHKISPASLEIEFTEETLLETELFGDELRKLEEAGFQLAVDDFGMGHSSLTYLMSMKIDRLKIDRSFVQDLASSPNNQALVTAIVGLGHLMNIPVIVEGVEHGSDVEILRLLGCQTGQGYAFGKPMPIDALLDWISAKTPLDAAAGISFSR